MDEGEKSEAEPEFTSQDLKPGSESSKQNHNSQALLKGLKNPKFCKEQFSEGGKKS